MDPTLDDRTRRTDSAQPVQETPRRPESSDKAPLRPAESSRTRPGRQRPRRGPEERDRWFGADESQSIAFYGEFYR